jgi:hypothetical protein
MPRNILAILYLLFLTGRCLAQVSGDSTVVYRPEKFHRYILSFDNRFSMFGPKLVGLSGMKAGYSVHHRFRFGVGFYLMIQPQDIVYSDQNQDYHARLSFWYASIYAEYVVVHHKRFEVSIPLMYIVGASPLLSAPGNNLPKDESLSAMQLMELSLNGYYKIFNWIGPGLGVGYRVLLKGNEFVENNFTGPVFMLRLQVFLNPLYRDLFPNGMGRKKEK